MDTGVVFKIHEIPGWNDLISSPFAKDTPYLNKTTYITKNNETYTMIRYNKTALTSDHDFYSHFGLLRCLIVNGDGIVVSFSPPKSMSFSSFQTAYPEKTADIVAEEFVEGIMINVFWNPKIQITGGWEIATRNTVGADIFYGCADPHNRTPKKTILNLFKETLSAVNLDLYTLDRRFCYSFVMQHPAISKGVAYFKKPELYFIEWYEIVNVPNGNLFIFPLDREKGYMNIGSKNGTTVKVPQKYENWTYYEDLENQYASANTDYSCQGVVIRNQKTGERTKLWNPSYHFIKDMVRWGGEGELYKYLVLRRHGKIKEFLEKNPNYKKKFARFRKIVHDFTETLYQNYIACFICKEQSIQDMKEIFRTHLNKLHSWYLNELREKKNYISNTKVFTYVNHLSPDQLFWCLHEPIRKRFYDVLLQGQEYKYD